MTRDKIKQIAYYNWLGFVTFRVLSDRNEVTGLSHEVALVYYEGAWQTLAERTSDDPNLGFIMPEWWESKGIAKTSWPEREVRRHFM